MTDDVPATTSPAAVVPAVKPLPLEAKLVPLIAWASYLLGVGILGLVIAYIDRGNVPGAVAGNYTYMIRTFWIGLAYSLLIVVLTLAAGVLHAIAVPLVMFTLGGLLFLWFLVRCVKGLVWLLRDLTLRDPATWLV